jgi:redox-sensitive bicupin YhaK (pirin superfamily)
MRASGRVWHSGAIDGTQPAHGFQVWLALPPKLELAEPQSQYLVAEEFRQAGPARVILGKYDGVASAIDAAAGIF